MIAVEHDHAQWTVAALALRESGKLLNSHTITYSLVRDAHGYHLAQLVGHISSPGQPKLARGRARTLAAPCRPEGPE